MRTITLCLLATLLFCTVSAAAAGARDKGESIRVSDLLYQNGSDTWIYIELKGHRDKPDDPWQATLWFSLNYNYGWGVGNNESFYVKDAPMPKDALWLHGNELEFTIDLVNTPGIEVEHCGPWLACEMDDTRILPNQYIHMTWNVRRSKVVSRTGVFHVWSASCEGAAFGFDVSAFPVNDCLSLYEGREGARFDLPPVDPDLPPEP